MVFYALNSSKRVRHYPSCFDLKCRASTTRATAPRHGLHPGAVICGEGTNRRSGMFLCPLFPLRAGPTVDGDLYYSANSNSPPHTPPPVSNPSQPPKKPSRLPLLPQIPLVAHARRSPRKCHAIPSNAYPGSSWVSITTVWIFHGLASTQLRRERRPALDEIVSRRNGSFLLTPRFLVQSRVENSRDDGLRIAKFDQRSGIQLYIY